jgi:tetratricopeptide (TPR) repeat protein
MIAKNEEHNIPGCLGCVADLVHEMIVADTGSTDQTKRAAAERGARVIDFPWIDDFAAARNASLHAATGDWIFWLDGDERLDEQNRLKLRQLFASLGDENAAYLMQQRSPSAGHGGEQRLFTHVRLFRNLPALRWQFRVHEQIMPALERHQAQVRWTDIVIDHTGYEAPDVYQRKTQRNLRLLEMMQREEPDNPFTLLNLGITCAALGHLPQAMGYWQRSLELSPRGVSMVRNLYVLLAQGSAQMDRRDDALAIIAQGLTTYPDDVELLFLDGVFRGNLGDLPGAERSLRRILEGAARDYVAVSGQLGLRGYKARHELARVCRVQGRDAEAEALWREALQEQPDFAPAWFELGMLFLQQQRFQEFNDIVDRQAAFPWGVINAAVLRTESSLRHGDYAAARRALEAAIAQMPRAVLLHSHLSQVLLMQQDWPAAEQALRTVLALDPEHAEARYNLTVMLKGLQRPADPLAPELAQRLSDRGERAFRAANYVEATQIYRSLLYANWQPDLCLARLAEIAARQGDMEGARALQRQAAANITFTA